MRIALGKDGTVGRQVDVSLVVLGVMAIKGKFS